MALRATPDDQRAGFEEQVAVHATLLQHHDSGWRVTRDLIKACSDSELNFLEKKRGDLELQLEDRTIGMEVQCSSWSPNCYWSRSKYIHSMCDWQCFVYRSLGLKLVMGTDRLRGVLGGIDSVAWRDAVDPYVLLWHEFLTDRGAVPLLEWCQRMRPSPVDV